MPDQLLVAIDQARERTVLARKHCRYQLLVVRHAFI
jgi:hypothetical protein